MYTAVYSFWINLNANLGTLVFTLCLSLKIMPLFYVSHMTYNVYTEHKNNRAQKYKKKKQKCTQYFSFYMLVFSLVGSLPLIWCGRRIHSRKHLWFMKAECWKISYWNRITSNWIHNKIDEQKKNSPSWIFMFITTGIVPPFDTINKICEHFTCAFSKRIY